MYRRPKFLELLLEIRETMASEADHDIDQFMQNLRQTSSNNSDAFAEPQRATRQNGTAAKKRHTNARRR
jgi:hypothetical protein